MDRSRRFRDRFWWWITHPAGVSERVKCVDPAQFPEREFPVRCMRCAYLLQGLDEARCPECGDPFDRGILLVEQYIRDRLPQCDSGRRVARRIMMVAAIITFVPLIAVGALLWLATSVAANSGGRMQIIDRAIAVIMVGKLMPPVGCILYCSAIFLELRSLPPRRKRQAVRNAWITANKDMENRNRRDGPNG